MTSPTRTLSATTCEGCGADLPPRARRWCSERCRKHTVYSGTCVGCGARTYNGLAQPPERCIRCAQKPFQVWTRDTVIAAIRGWARDHGGVPPSATRWSPGQAIRHGRPEWAEEYRDGHWPPVHRVQVLFGSWSAAIAAAGFTPRKVGEYERRPR